MTCIQENGSLFYDRIKLIETDGVPTAMVAHLMETNAVDMNGSLLMFSMMKIFDASIPDDAAENYYMEREWRIVDNLNFAVGDVARVIVPGQYAGRLAQAVPEYNGKVTLA